MPQARRATPRIARTISAVVALTTVLSSCSGSNGRSQPSASRSQSSASATSNAPNASQLFETRSCADALQLLAQSRSQRSASATDSTPETAPLSSFIPRDAPGPGWSDEYEGGPAPGVTSLPAGTVSEDRTSLVPNGIEEGFIRGFRQPADQTRVFYAVYRFASGDGAVKVEDAVVSRACQRYPDFLTTPDGVVGASRSGPNGGNIDLAFVRNGLLFDFYSDSPQPAALEQTRPLAGHFFESAAHADLGPSDTTSVARTTASAACGRLRFLVSDAETEGVTVDEFRDAAQQSAASITNASVDADALAVSNSLDALVNSIVPPDSASAAPTFTAAAITVERAAQLDNACRRLTDQGVFRD